MAKVYEVKLNDVGEKVCVIKGKEVKVVAESADYLLLEDGTKLNVLVDLNDPLEIIASEEGELIAGTNNNSVEFIRSAPANPVVDYGGREVAYRVVGSTKSKMRGTRYAQRRRIQSEGFEELSLDESENGTANLVRRKTIRGKTSSIAEYLINATGRDLGTKGVYSGPKVVGKIRTGGGIRPVSEKLTKGTQGHDKDKGKKRLALLIVPLIIGIPILLRGCNKDRPKPDPDPDISMADDTDPEPEPSPDIDPENPDPQIEVAITLIESLRDFDADLTQIRSGSYPEAESIYYDLDSYVDGDLDSNIETYLGPDYVGLRRGDGVPSSFHRQLSADYGLNEMQEHVQVVNDVVEIINMDDTRLIAELNQSKISPGKHGTQNFRLEAIAALIEERTGYDIFEKDDVTALLTCFEEYATEQCNSRENFITLKEAHKETTEKSIPNRPNQEAIESYEAEVGLHELSIQEEKNKLPHDRAQLKAIQDMQAILQQANSQIVYYVDGQRYVVQEGQVYTTTVPVQNVVQNTQNTQVIETEERE